MKAKCKLLANSQNHVYMCLKCFWMFLVFWPVSNRNQDFCEQRTKSQTDHTLLNHCGWQFSFLAPDWFLSFTDSIIVVAFVKLHVSVYYFIWCTHFLSGLAVKLLMRQAGLMHLWMPLLWESKSFQMKIAPFSIVTFTLVMLIRWETIAQHKTLASKQFHIFYYKTLLPPSQQPNKSICVLKYKKWEKKEDNFSVCLSHFYSLVVHENKINGFPLCYSN